jgi:hypothetical protein
MIEQVIITVMQSGVTGEVYLIGERHVENWHPGSIQRTIRDARQYVRVRTKRAIWHILVDQTTWIYQDGEEREFAPVYAQSYLDGLVAEILDGGWPSRTICFYEYGELEK